MSTAPLIEAPLGLDFGRLANNYMSVQALRTALSRSETNIQLIPKLVVRILRTGAWHEWLEGDDGYHCRWKLSNPADFRMFISEPIDEDGCGCPLHVFERMIRETEAWNPYELTRGKPGGVVGNPGNPNPVPNPFGRAGKQERTDREDITDSSIGVIATLPLSQGNPRKRDYKREAPTGTSTSYVMRCLERGKAGKPARPDLLERVKAGELTPFGAAVEAGFVPKKIAIEDDPVAASRVILKRFVGDDLLTLLHELANHAGYDLVERT